MLSFNNIPKLTFYLKLGKFLEIKISILLDYFFFLKGVKEECIYALCVGLAKDNTIPTKPPILKQ